MTKDSELGGSKNSPFNIHGSMHHNNILIYISNKMHVLQSLSDNCSTCFGCHHPSSGAQNNCNYSIW